MLRDPIACKPAVMAETDDWVAFGTEYRALVDLPGIDARAVWEPEPATRLFLGARADAGRSISPQTPLRELNAALHQLERRHQRDAIGACSIRAAQHAIAAGLDAPVTVKIDGHVGYYCAGMNKQATVVVNGNAGAGRRREHDVGPACT